MSKKDDIKFAAYQQQEGEKVRCLLCPHNCLLAPGQKGFCRARANIDGALIAQSYGKITSLAVDPMTKKPFNRYYPENTILTLGSYGCNLSCQFCQNYSISQCCADYTYYSPEEVLQLALHHTVNDNIGLAFSYNEPTIAWEYVKDCFELMRQRNLKTILVTNGYLHTKPFTELAKLTDAMNIDLKAFTNGFYKNICHGDLETVKNNIKIAAQYCHVEVTTLIVPGLNDSLEEIENMARWLSEIDPEIPYHLSRFFPRYKMTDKEPTPVDTIDDAAEIAARYLKYIYWGNI